MNVLYEEQGGLRVGAVLAEAATTLQVEAPHGKRSKVKGAQVLLRFEAPPIAGFMEEAQRLAEGLDPGFLWECCSGRDEVGFEALARDYFGHAPGPLEAAALLLRLHGSPMHFYKKGKGRYRPAPPDALKAALASVEKKRRQAELQARYAEELAAFRLPAEFGPRLDELLYQPDKASTEWKALEAASVAQRLSVPRLLERCGALPSSHDYHFRRFLFTHFPRGTGFPDWGAAAEPAGLPVAEAAAFSIDDAATTEIDDAFSLAELPGGGLRVGIHIAAPALGFAPGSPLDALAAQRLSTVYFPGGKITMLPEEVIHRFTLGEERVCPALSLYLTVGPDFAVLGSESRIERVRIAANLRHDTLEEHFNEYTLEADAVHHPFGGELRRLWEFACALEARRGKAGEGAPPLDYHFRVENDRVTISARRRGAPIDKLVAELMILVNSEWGRALAEAGLPAIFRTQAEGKVKLATGAAPHQGLGVTHYAWASSPLRRYVDLVNQRQLVALIRGEPPPYARNSEALLTALRDFEAAYDAYNEFQRGMERYWSLRWLLQEQKQAVAGTVIRESLVRLEGLPLVARAPSLPDLPAGARVELEVGGVDLLELNFSARFLRRLDGGGDAVQV